jgi:hypothetical protein
MRRYFYGWRTHEQCDPVIRRHSMLALLWWSRSVYRAAWQQWRERYCYLYLGRLVEERADKVYQVSLLTAAVECWRVELYCRLNERLLEGKTGVSA